MSEIIPVEMIVEDSKGEELLFRRKGEDNSISVRDPRFLGEKEVCFTYLEGRDVEGNRVNTLREDKYDALMSEAPQGTNVYYSGSESSERLGVEGEPSLRSMKMKTRFYAISEECFDSIMGRD